MNTTEVPKDATRSRPVRRADVSASVFFLLGVTFLVRNGRAALTGPVPLHEVGGAVVSLFAIGGAVYTYRHPEETHRGTDPASRAYLALAGVSTLAAGYVLVDSILAVLS
jgi:hypothetical protein